VAPVGASTRSLPERSSFCCLQASTSEWLFVCAGLGLCDGACACYDEAYVRSSKEGIRDKRSLELRCLEICPFLCDPGRLLRSREPCEPCAARNMHSCNDLPAMIGNDCAHRQQCFQLNAASPHLLRSASVVRLCNRQTGVLFSVAHPSWLLKISASSRYPDRATGVSW
jgi:hypothetical protein